MTQTMESQAPEAQGTLPRVSHWINGAIVRSTSGQSRPVFNPATGTIFVVERDSEFESTAIKPIFEIDLSTSPPMIVDTIDLVDGDGAPVSVDGEGLAATLNPDTGELEFWVATEGNPTNARRNEIHRVAADGEVTLTIDTRHMMFLCGGAFEGLYDQVYLRVVKPGSGEKLKSQAIQTADGQVRIDSGAYIELVVGGSTVRLSRPGVVDLGEGILEQRAGVAGVGARGLGPVQVAQGHVVEGREGRGRDVAGAADGQGPLGLALGAAGDEAVGDEDAAFALGHLGRGGGGDAAHRDRDPGRHRTGGDDQGDSQRRQPLLQAHRPQDQEARRQSRSLPVWKVRPAGKLRSPELLRCLCRQRHRPEPRCSSSGD